MKTQSYIAKVIMIGGGCLLLILASIPTLWSLRHLYYEPQKKEAMQFCESLIPVIEASKKNGVYPDNVDPKWIQGRNVPELIRAQDFYLSSGPRYLLRFRNPGDFMDDIWGYQGSSRTGNWINYDGY